MTGSHEVDGSIPFSSTKDFSGLRVFVTPFSVIRKIYGFISPSSIYPFQATSHIKQPVIFCRFSLSHPVKMSLFKDITCI